MTLEPLESRTLLSTGVDIPTYRNDAGSTGQNLNEAILTPANVNSGTFGKRFTRTLDGQVYAQPLYMTNVNITRGSSQGIHNVLYVATQQDSLYALDANTGAILWQDSFLNVTNPTSLSATAGVTPISANGTVSNSGNIGSNDTVNTNDVNPELGILSTPVIDPSTDVLYLVAATKEYRNGSTPTSSTSGADRHFVQRLWGVNLSDGSAALGGPAVIGDTVKNTTIGGLLSQYTGYQYFAGPIITGTGNNAPVNDSANHMNTNADGWIASTDPGHLGYIPSASGQIAFNALLQMGRPAMSLVNGNIYLGFASHGDNGPYYGWLLGYSASDLSLNAAFVTCPTFENIAGNRADYRAQSGIWMSGDRITSDDQGNLYVTIGNGIFNTDAANFDANGFPIDHDYGDAILKLSADPASSFNNQNGNGYGLKVVDFFVPSNAKRLNEIDADMGSGGVLLLPDNAGNIAGHPHLLITGGKEGRIYLVDRDDMGKFNTAYNSQPTGTDPRAYDRVVGEIPPSAGTNSQSNQYYSTGSYFDGKYYIALANKFGQVWNVSALAAPTSPPGNSFNPPPLQTTNSWIKSFGQRGATFSISANGSSDGIIWALANRSPKDGANVIMTDGLFALDADHFDALPLFNSGSGSNSLIGAGGGTAGVKFSVPTVANGLVYAGTGGINSSNAADGLGSIVVYGLLNPNLAAASDLQASQTNSTTNHLSWTDNSGAESFFQIERSPNGTSDWNVIAYVGNDTTSFDDTTVTPGQPYSYRVKAIYGPDSGSYSNIATVVVSPPTVTASSFTWQDFPQRLSFTFDQDVSASLSAADLQLQNTTTSSMIATASIALDWNAATNTATFTFSTSPSGALPDGNYHATLLASGISNSSGTPMSSDYSTDFFFLNGDANHDGTVDVTDLGILATNWQSSSGKNYQVGDFNYDGIVDVTDLGILATNWQKNLPPPSLPVSRVATLPGVVHGSAVRHTSRGTLVQDVLN